LGPLLEVLQDNPEFVCRPNSTSSRRRCLSRVAASLTSNALAIAAPASAAATDSLPRRRSGTAARTSTPTD